MAKAWREGGSSRRAGTSPATTSCAVTSPQHHNSQTHNSQHPASTMGALLSIPFLAMPAMGSVCPYNPATARAANVARFGASPPPAVAPRHAALLWAHAEESAEIGGLYKELRSWPILTSP
jgi:hypothetical protein